MYNGKSILAIIPARSGSKGIKDKNIRLIVGKPLMVYSIEAAIQSKICDKIIVSTDSEKYAEIAREHGVGVPFLRAKQISTDVTGTWDVVKDVIEKLNVVGERYDIVLVLQPTSPLRNAEDIVGAFALMENKNANTVVSVCESEYSLENINYLKDDGSMELFFTQNDSNINHLPRQLMKKAYRINGAIFITKTDFILQSKDVYSARCFSYEMPRNRSLDIDEPIDITIAETILFNQSEIRIRLAEEEDFHEYYLMKCEKKNIFWCGYKDVPNVEVLRTFFNKTISEQKLPYSRKLCLIIQNSEARGYIYVDFHQNQEKECEVSIAIKHHCEGLGIATKALRKTIQGLENQGICKIIAYIREDNVASQKVFTNCGFSVVKNEDCTKYMDFLGKELKLFKYAHYKLNCI